MSPEQGTPRMAAEEVGVADHQGVGEGVLPHLS